MTHLIVSLIHINPAQAVIGENVRLDARLDKDFLASIRAEGVLEPVVGYHDDEGQFVVLRGQRRTLAAAQVEAENIPAVLVARPEDVDRVVHQMAENDHRAAMSTAERVAAVEQLAGFGLTAAQIKRRTARPRTEVDAALTVASSEIAKKAALRWDFLTLDQAATLADFDADTEAVKALTVAAKEGQFDHVAQRLRDAREQEQLREQAREAIEAEGTTYLAEFDPYGSTKGGSRLTDLTNSTNETDRGALTTEAHKECPGHAAYVRVGYSWSADERVRQADVIYVCTDPKANGHTERYATNGSSAKPKAADLSDTEREAAKAQRRDVIEANKAWDAAEPVRREFVRTYVTRKTAPKGAAHLIAHAITGHWSTSAEVDHMRVAEVARAFRVAPTDTEVDKATDGRALVLVLGRVLAGYESKTSRGSWRTVSAHTALYLKFLAANGYTLSPVEERATGSAKKK